LISGAIDTQKALAQQQSEIDEYAIYTRLAKLAKKEANRKILLQIAQEERNHYRFWEKITKKSLHPRRHLVLFYLFLARFFGLSFALKLLEKREEGAEEFYRQLFDLYPEAKSIYAQESNHETKLLNMLNDEKLLYAGAVVLGMNDALVELTGTLTGIAFAFDKSFSVGVTGAILGIAASLSMAGSAYLEARDNPSPKIRPATYAVYTGLSYIFTTLLLVLPYFFFNTTLPALAVMFAAAVAAIVAYNFYISVARDEPFFKRVREMALITFGVSLITFGIGYVVRNWFGIEI
jgi:VIT1/CCC1 family predicted Fe2+/Mn2+ transporter